MELSRALDEIERQGLAATTGFNFKAAMDLLRSFFERFIQEAVRLVAAKAQRDVPSGDKLSHFRPFKDYLRAVGILVREEDEHLQTLYNYVSNVGSHALGSAPEQFHVAKTTVVEWCMMTAGRIREFLANP